MHKQILVILFALLLPLIGHAQLEKGMRQFNDNSQYAIFFSEGSTLTLGGLSQRSGWMVSNNFLIGTTYGAGIITSDGFSEQFILAGPFLRYYFNPTNPKTNFYIGAETNFLILLGDGDGFTSLAIGAGLNTFIKKDFSLRAGISLEWNSETFNPDPDASTTVIFANFENFFQRDAWKERRSITDPSQKGSFLLGDPQASLRFLLGTTAIDLSATLGYFFSDNFAGGINVGISDSGFSRNVRFIPFGRYYLSKARTSWFLQAEAGRDYFALQDFFFTGGFTEATWTFFGGAGFNKFLSPNVAIEAKIGLSAQTNTAITTLAGQFGMQYYIHQ